MHILLYTSHEKRSDTPPSRKTGVGEHFLTHRAVSSEQTIHIHTDEKNEKREPRARSCMLLLLLLLLLLLFWSSIILLFRLCLLLLCSSTKKDTRYFGYFPLLLDRLFEKGPPFSTPRAAPALFLLPFSCALASHKKDRKKGGKCDKETKRILLHTISINSLLSLFSFSRPARPPSTDGPCRTLRGSRKHPG